MSDTAAFEQKMTELKGEVERLKALLKSRRKALRAMAVALERYRGEA